MKYIVAVIVAFVLALGPATPAYAISEPDSTPTVNEIYCFRHVLETNDMLIMYLESTPYATTPTDYTYSQAFIWRLMDGDNETAQAHVCDYNENGFGYNLISFYFAAADAPAWAGDYTLRLSGSPAAFADPPVYNYPIPASAYSSLTDEDEVEDAITDLVLNWANEFYAYWGLTYLTTLVEETETGTVLSLSGQTFFRCAIYGLQGMAPDVFPLTIENYDVTYRTWTSDYADNLTGQHAGSYIEEGFDAGEDFFGTDYNLMGMLIVIGVGAVLVFANWYLSGGNIWKGAIEMVPALVIFTRLGVWGLGELGLIAACSWIYVCARIWKLV